MSAADDALGRVLEVAAGMIELLEDASQRPDTNVSSLKAQCFDLVLEAVATGARNLEVDASAPAQLRDRARAVVERAQRYRRASVDARLHLIELTEDWKCSVCSRDVGAGVAVASRSPLAAVVLCRACGARSPLGPRGARRLEELFGHLASPEWNPARNGFVV